MSGTLTSRPGRVSSNPPSNKMAALRLSGRTVFMLTETYLSIAGLTRDGVTACEPCAISATARVPERTGPRRAGNARREALFHPLPWGENARICPYCIQLCLTRPDWIRYKRSGTNRCPLLDTK